MFALILAAAIHVSPGQTLSGIAASNGVSLAAVESANPGISDPNLIFPGESVSLPGSSSGDSESSTETDTAPVDVSATQDSSAPSDGTSSQSTGTSAPQQQSVTVSGGSGFQQCVISHESSGNSQVMNSSGHYGLYQFDLPTWVAGGGNPADFGNASVSEQNQVFQSTYAARGAEPWQGDGC